MTATHHAPTKSDGGFKSRKLLMTILVMALIFVGFIAAGRWTGLAAVYGEYVMGMLAAGGSYLSANAATKFIYFKHGKPDKNSAPPTPPTHP